MKVIYIAGKFTGPDAWAIEKNIRLAEECAFEVAQCGAMPLCPHTNTRFFHGTKTPAFWYAGTMELLRRCDAIFLVPGWSDSQGARSEVAEAERLGLQRLFSPVEVELWLMKQ